MSGNLSFAAAFAVAASSAFTAAAAETRIGIVGADTSHTAAFVKIMNVDKDPDVAGFRVTHAYKWGSRDIPGCTNRYSKIVPEIEAAGVKMTETIAELVANVDCVMLETCDGRPHLEQAREILASGKPCYIDKPLAGDMRDSLAILRLAKRAGVQVFCASSLRYTKAVKAAVRGEYGGIRAADMFAPGNYEPTNSRYFWYAIHGADPLFATMGTGCRDVTCVSGGDSDVIVGRWADGRTGTVRVFHERGGYGGSVVNDERKLFDLGGYEGYKVLLVEILKFFKTGVSPIPQDELEEVYLFLDAARISRERGGKTVSLSETRALASDGRGFSPDLPDDGPKPWTHLDFQDDEDDFHFAIVPDRTGGDYRGAFTNALAKVNMMRPAFVMTVGDLIPGLKPPEVIRPQQIALTNMASKVIAPFFYVVGNHDIGRSRPEYPRNSEESLAVWNEFFGPRTYYSFMYKGVLFVVLNTMEGRDCRRPQCGITKEQYAWFKKTLDDHADARWTMVFMHQPYEWKTAGWIEFEKTELAKRNYTVFAGDWHHYLYARRHGRDYYVLGVAGGCSADNPGKSHILRGVDYGEMDHLTWVTMTKGGPVVANLTLDGILPGDYLTQRNTLSEAQAYPIDEPPDRDVVEKLKKIAADRAAKNKKK